LDLMNKAHVLLMDSLKFVQENCSPEEYKEFQAGMAHVLGRLFFLLMEPIYMEHPSLAPSDTPKEFIESWRKRSSEDSMVTGSALRLASWVDARAWLQITRSPDVVVVAGLLRAPCLRA
jgi:hypothetical protein